MKITLVLIAVFILKASIEDSNRMDITVVDKRPNILLQLATTNIIPILVL